MIVGEEIRINFGQGIFAFRAEMESFLLRMERSATTKIVLLGMDVHLAASLMQERILLCVLSTSTGRQYAIIVEMGYEMELKFVTMGIQQTRMVA